MLIHHCDLVGKIVGETLGVHIFNNKFIDLNLFADYVSDFFVEYADIYGRCDFEREILAKQIERCLSNYNLAVKKHNVTFNVIRALFYDENISF